MNPETYKMSYNKLDYKFRTNKLQILVSPQYMHVLDSHHS